MRGFNLSAWALAHRPLIGFAIVASALLGIFSFFALGRSEDPAFTFKIMVIHTVWPGATAAETERLVTDRIEKKLEELPYYDHTRSFSKPGESTIFLELRDSTPPAAVPEQFYQARKKIGDIASTLPAGIHGPLFNDEFGDVYSAIYAFMGKDFTPAQMKKIIEEARERLLRIPDVEKADLIGLQDERIWIEVSSQHLAELGLSISKLADAIDRSNAVVDGGEIDTASDQIVVRVDNGLAGLDRLRALPIRVGDRVVTLGDIATVRRGYLDPRIYAARYEGRDALELGIVMVRGGNVLKLGDNLKRAMTGIEATLPAGVDVALVADQSTVVKHAVGEFEESLFEALLIVMAVSFLSLGWRTGLIVALTVPLVLGLTFAVMLAMHIDIHRISSGALIIALGLLVDDAIIAVEMMLVKMEQGWDRIRAGTFAFTSTAMPTLTGTLLTIEGFIPVGFAQSSTAEYTNAIFWVAGTALVVSWFVAVLFVPYLGYRLLPEPRQIHGSAPDLYQGPAYRQLRRVLHFCLSRRPLTLGITAGVFVLALLGFGGVKQQFFPSSVRPELIVSLQLAEGASFEATRADVARMERFLAQQSGVESYAAYIGGSAPHFYLSLLQDLPRANIAQFVVIAKGTDARENLRHIIASHAAADFPDTRVRLSALEDGPPVGYPVQFRIMGGDPLIIRSIADRLRHIMESEPDLQNVNLDWGNLAKRIRIDVDPAKAAALGVSMADLSQSLDVLLRGLPVTQFRDGTELIDVMIRAPNAERDDPARLGELQIPLADGRTVSLDQLAHVHFDAEEPIFWRRDRLTELTVQADVADGVQAPDASNAVEAKLAPLRASLPDGYRIETGGAIEASQTGNTAIGKMIPIMLFLMVSTLMLQLQSMSRVVMVLLTAPLGIVGVTLALLATGKPFGFVALLGVIALFGIIMRNSIVLIDQIDQDIAAGVPPASAVVEATIRRARPILLTASASALAMIPLAGSLFWGPLGIAIMGGLMIATVITLLFVPAFYAMWFRVARPE